MSHDRRLPSLTLIVFLIYMYIIPIAYNYILRVQMTLLTEKLIYSYWFLYYYTYIHKR